MRSDTALLWDESYLWGIMACDALRRVGLGFTLVRASDVRAGCLSDYKAILVPGGWASNKMRSLGDEGVSAIRDFVSSGGTYIGFCGGAGLATSDGIGLIKVKRKPLSLRVPSVSGPVRLALSGHPLWEGVGEPLFDIWWPSQFVTEDDALKVLATFGEASPEAFSSDYCVGDMAGAGWGDAEKSYGINLDPSRMSGDPMVVEGAYGQGRVLVSLVHFDTPGSREGEQVLNNMWDYLGLNKRACALGGHSGPGGKLYERAAEIISYGERNFIWFRHGPLLRWRRGVRGLEYFTLYRMAEEISRRIGEGTEADGMGELESMMNTFTGKAVRLLGLERGALQRGERITFHETRDSGIKALRDELFSRSKSYGGFFKELLDGLDGLLYRLLLSEMDEGREAPDKQPGLLHIYTGDGKGKTTASVGLALRAASRGLKVLFAQFLKDRAGGEPDALKGIGVDVMKFKKVLSPLFHDVEQAEVRSEALLALRELSPARLEGYDMVVLDEFVTLVTKGFIAEAEAIEFLGHRPASTELVITGRGAGEGLIKCADLVTRMDHIKHPYENGTGARAGIEY